MGMASFGRLFVNYWSEDDLGLSRPSLSALAQPARSEPAPPHSSDVFVVPPSITAPVIPPSDDPSAPIPFTSGEQLEDRPAFERMLDITFFDVTGDGSADKLARMLDEHYIPPTVDLL